MGSSPPPLPQTGTLRTPLEGYTELIKRNSKRNAAYEQKLSKEILAEERENVKFDLLG